MYVIHQLTELRKEIAHLAEQSVEDRAVTRDVGAIAVVALVAAGFLLWDRWRQARAAAPIQPWDGSIAVPLRRVRADGGRVTTLDDISTELARLRDAVDRVAAEVTKGAARPH
jgi:hypothetical protein